MGDSKRFNKKCQRGFVLYKILKNEILLICNPTGILLVKNKKWRQWCLFKYKILKIPTFLFDHTQYSDLKIQVVSNIIFDNDLRCLDEYNIERWDLRAQAVCFRLWDISRCSIRTMVSPNNARGQYPNVLKALKEISSCDSFSNFYESRKSTEKRKAMLKNVFFGITTCQ